MSADDSFAQSPGLFGHGVRGSSRLLYKRGILLGKTWRRSNGPEQIKLLLEGIAVKDREPDDRPVQQRLAA